MGGGSVPGFVRLFPPRRVDTHWLGGFPSGVAWQRLFPGTSIMIAKDLPAPTAPAWARLLLLLLLPLFAAALYLEGQRFDDGLIELKREADPGRDALAFLPNEMAGLAVVGRGRNYHKDNLYEYINGHAEYYLSAGFTGLAVMEYGPGGAQQPSLVLNLYHMGEPLYAFGALMDELADSAQPVDSGDMGFSVDQGINLIVGPWYAQLSAFDEGVALEQAARQLDPLLQQHRGDGDKLDLSFPELGTPLETYFVKEDYRGIGVLDNVLERIFERNGAEITAFLLTGKSAKIGQTRDDLLGFLAQDGIEYSLQETPNGDYYRVEDPYEGEWFFVARNERLIGVFTPPEAGLLERILGSSE